MPANSRASKILVLGLGKDKLRLENAGEVGDNAILETRQEETLRGILGERSKING